MKMTTEKLVLADPSTGIISTTCNQRVPTHIPTRSHCNYIVKVKVKLSLCLTNEALCHEGVWGSGCIHPHFLTSASVGSE
jgi:hypothetical protein